MRVSLSKKIARMLLAIALSLSVVLILLSFFFYYSRTMKHYETQAKNIAAIAATRINPDKIQYYLSKALENPEYQPDAEYEAMREELSELQRASGVEYIYIVKPVPEIVYYVLDTDPDPDTRTKIGAYEEYYDGVFKKHEDDMVNGRELPGMISKETYGWLMSGFCAVSDSSGNFAGYTAADIAMREVQKDLLLFACSMLLLIVCMTTGLTHFFIRLTAKTISEPVKALSQAAEKVVEEEESGQELDSSIFSNLVIRSNDEIGDLYQSLKKMERDIQDYMTKLMRVTAEKERYSAELNVATQIQADMLPNIFPPYPERSEFDIFATMNPAKQVGGDFYDFFLVDDDHLAMVMADVSGKGVPAALFMVIAKTLIKNRAGKGESPAEIFANVNKQLCDGNKAGMFVTVWLGILELSTGLVKEANAGHEDPAIRRKDGVYELRKYRHSPPLGMIDGISFHEHEFQLNPGDSLYVYTDGVTEAANVKEELFGAQRLLNILNRDPSASPKALLFSVKSEIDDFAGEAEQCDDITMLGLQYFGPLMSGEILRLAKSWLNKRDGQAKSDKADT